MKPVNRIDERDPIDDPPVEPHRPFIVAFDVSSPAPGSTLVGPFNGVTLTVIGAARVLSGEGSINRVEVSLDGGGFVTASLVGNQWSCSQLITSSGGQNVTARLIDDEGQVIRTRQVSVTTALQPPPSPGTPPPTNTQPPSVAITAPASADTIVLDGNGEAQVSVTCVAKDLGGAIQTVKVSVDGASVDAARGVAADTWTAQAVIVGQGPHGITATATDLAGLSASTSVQITAATTPPTAPVVERLLLVEKCQLTSYLGAYGPGRTIRTIPLAPNQVTKLAVKSYRRDSDTNTQASSVLDSHTDESQQDFENTLANEQSNKTLASESSSWNVSGEASAGWGWGSASIKAGASGTSNASREELAKNVANAVQKHAAKASSSATSRSRPATR